MNKYKPVAKVSYPAISVIIPMYNAEKFIGTCLESLLAQKFTDFEVIVVNDCSTDSSYAIVESYREKFDGRLTLAHMKENSGAAALPRNKGLNLSRGEYVYFLDSDDILINTALAEMYTLAKNYDADVVCCERHWEFGADGKIYLQTHQTGKLIDTPTFQSEDLGERLNELLQKDIWGGPLYKLTRRNFLVDNEIVFPNLRVCEDYFWTLNLFFHAKRFLRVPNAIYIEIKSESSLSRSNRTPQQRLSLWLNSAILGLKGLDNMLGELNFFRDNPQHRHAVINFFLNKMLAFGFQMGITLPPFEYYETIKQDFSSRLGEQDVLVAALCTLVNTLQRANILNIQQFNKVIAQVQEQFNKFNQFAEQAQKRIVELESVIQAQQKNNVANIQQFQKFALQAQARIAELEAKVNRLKK